MGAAASCPVCGQGSPEFICKAVLYAGREKDIRECRSCGAAYYFPVPASEEIARCYPPVYYRDFFRQYWKDYYKGRALAEKLSGWRSGGEFLDVGCALGTMLAGVRDHSGWKVRGLEFSEGTAELGRGLNGVEIQSAPLARAAWPEGSFDYVHINNVLEHESDPAAALGAAARLLRKGGRLELTVPNGPVDLLPNRTLYRKWGRPVVTRHGGHLFFLSRRALGALFERCGLEVLSVRGFHFKQGLKARGWLPKAYRLFERGPAPASAGEGLTLAEGRALIPARPNWPLYRWRYRWRRLWRLADNEFGYDFEVLAEKH